MITESIDTRNAADAIEAGSIVQYFQESYVDGSKLDKAVESPLLEYLGQHARVLRMMSGNDTAKVQFADGHWNYILLTDLRPATQADFDADVLWTLSKQALAILKQVTALHNEHGQLAPAVNDSLSLAINLRKGAERLRDHTGEAAQ